MYKEKETYRRMMNIEYRYIDRGNRSKNISVGMRTLEQNKTIKRQLQDTFFNQCE